MARLGDTDFVVRWFQEVWNEGRESAIDELAAPGVVFHTLRGGIIGAATFKRFHRALRAQIEGLKFEILHALGIDEFQSAYCVVRGLQRSTGRPVQFMGGGFGRIRDGRLQEAWDAWTFLDLAEQMSIIAPGAFERMLGAPGAA
jgi:hypothetical protein